MSVSSSKLTQKGKFIIFGIAKDLFSVEVNNLKEVFQTDRILQLPRTSKVLAGIVNLRGTIISVFDLSMLLWGNESEYLSVKLEDKSSKKVMNVLLMNIKGQDMGILVDYIHQLGEISKFEKKNEVKLEKKGFLDSSIIKNIGILEDTKKVFILELEGLLTGYVPTPKEKKYTLEEDDDFDFSQYTLPDPEELTEEKQSEESSSDTDLDLEMLKLPDDDSETVDEFDFENKGTEMIKKKSKKKN